MLEYKMKYRCFGRLLVIEALALACLTVAGGLSAAGFEPIRRDNQNLAQVLVLTDLAIWTEARYTRHPSLADLFSAFQDSPAALEHFPAGALLPPPATETFAAYGEKEHEPAS